MSILICVNVNDFESIGFSRKRHKLASMWNFGTERISRYGDRGMVELTICQIQGYYSKTIQTICDKFYGRIGFMYVCKL